MTEDMEVMVERDEARKQVAELEEAVSLFGDEVRDLIRERDEARNQVETLLAGLRQANQQADEARAHVVELEALKGVSPLKMDGEEYRSRTAMQLYREREVELAALKLEVAQVRGQMDEARNQVAALEANAKLGTENALRELDKRDVENAALRGALSKEACWGDKCSSNGMGGFELCSRCAALSPPAAPAKEPSPVDRLTDLLKEAGLTPRIVMPDAPERGEE